MKTHENIYLIDAVGFLFKSYYAITPMTNAQGVSTHALYGFIRSLQKLIKDFSPTHVVAVFDGPDNSASRKKIYADYKGHRKGMPPDLVSQLVLALQFCELYGIPYLQVPGVEADDTIASLVQWLENHQHTSYICSSDKDLCQLVSDHTFVINTHKNNLVIDKHKVKELFDVRPDQIVDLLAIMGDSSDNIPGIAGFGPKTASKLLQEHESIDHLLNHLDSLKNKSQQQKIKENKDILLLSKQLASLDFNVSIPTDMNFFKLRSPQQEALMQFYKDMNFLSLLKEFASAKETRFSNTSNHYTLIQTQEDLLQLISTLSSSSEIVVDTETTHLHPMKAELVGIGFCIQSSHAYYIPTNGTLPLSTILQAIKPLLENPHIKFIGHNLKYDLHVLKNYDIDIKNIYFDTMLASYLINSQSHRHGLDHLCLELFGKVKIPIEDLIGHGKNQRSMKEVPLELIKDYCCEDVDYTFRLKELFYEKLHQEHLWKVFTTIEMPLLPVLASMERHGMSVDVKELQELSAYLKVEIDAVQSEIFKDTGEEFNLNSPKQLGCILYEKLHIPPPNKRGVPEFSTSASVLESLQDRYPICKKILHYRGLEKLRSTYVDTLPEQILTSTGRIHCTFNQSVAATGRLSCQDPNLQNIPIRTEEGKKIRYAFKAAPHYSFISADYSQIELRILAHLSQDEALMNAFIHGEDIHNSTASLVFNTPQKEVTKEMRHLAKAVNFGILYGQQAFGLSQQLGISMQEASRFITTYFERYPKIKAFLESCKEKAHQTGTATTFTGRKRLLIDIHSKNPSLKATAERLAVNTPIQGAQADIIKLAMIEIHKRLTQSPHLGAMILQIHDELMFEVPDNALSETKSLVKTIMENIVVLSVPLTVDVAIGKNWGEC
jgi:DNA polymerase-1